ncbi:MAG: SpoIVB peptidase S55 domain-containing protein [Candidatus Acidoferrales bacterium]
MVRRILFSALLVLLLSAGARAQTTEILPLDQIRPGMKGVARTVFAGQEIETFDVEVLGVLRNFVGPHQDLILVRLLGDNVLHTGVVAGMSGSPVYFDGKLAGAISFRFGIFTKEPIAGVTPIENMLRAAQEDTQVAAEPPRRYRLPEPSLAAVGIPTGTDAYLMPIETPLSFVGFHPQVIRRFSDQLAQYGLLAVAGGSSANPGQSAPLEAGGAVAAALVTGDMTVAGTCTISLRVGDQIFACGHWLLGYGNVELPMARAEIVTTVASEFSSFKVTNIGEVVGRFEQDRRSAIVGRLGSPPPMVPVDLRLEHRGRVSEYHYQIFQHPKISPLLLNLTLFNGIFNSIESGEELTYRVTGRLVLRDHPDVILDDMFSPSDSFFPDAFFVVNSVGNIFRQIFTNPFESPAIERIALRIELIPERRAATIENAWSDQSEVRPGETIRVKVVLQPYRGQRQVREILVPIPAQAAQGQLRILVSDATMLNRITRTMLFGFGLPGRFRPGPRVTSLEQLIRLLNRERRNDRLYVSLFQRSPTLLVEDKVLPSVPLSQMNVLNPQSAAGQPGGTLLFYESILSETSQPLGQVITGSHWLLLTVR